MIQTSAVAFRQNLSEMLNQGQYRQDHVLISKHGKPAAALADIRLYERIRRQRRRFDALSERLAMGFVALPPDESAAGIKAALRAERSGP